MIRENIYARHARASISQKKRCQWTAREKLMIIAYSINMVRGNIRVRRARARISQKRNINRL